MYKQKLENFWKNKLNMGNILFVFFNTFHFSKTIISKMVILFNKISIFFRNSKIYVVYYYVKRTNLNICCL